MLFNFLFSNSMIPENTTSIMTESARLFVEQIIVENDTRFMKNILDYYLSTRDLDESLQICLLNTNSKDTLVIRAFHYFEIIPPITQNLNDFSQSLKSFIFKMFTMNQILTYNNCDALEFLSSI
ncbi:hypothetical protein [Flavobacterium sp. W22_SRS_FP1]|uniref:hypothetical protein n=1 Tax=Flavobacterium sp. W22_SRS_FP1 TaxID=3240276 RepID=UPI003F9264EF